MILRRRGLLGALSGLVAAPALIREGFAMPVKPWVPPPPAPVAFPPVMGWGRPTHALIMDEAGRVLATLDMAADVPFVPGRSPVTRGIARGAIVETGVATDFVVTDGHHPLFFGKLDSALPSVVDRIYPAAAKRGQPLYAGDIAHLDLRLTLE